MKKQNNQKKSHKKLWIILGIILAVLILFIVLIVRGLQNMTKQLTESLSNTAAVETGEIAVITEGTGVVETADAETIHTDYNVTLRHLYKKNGEFVAAGEAIAEYDGIVLDDTVAALESQLSQIDTQLSYMSKSGTTRVTTAVSGRVKQIYAKEGDSVLTVQSHYPGLALISADGNLKVEISPKAAVEVGQKVRIQYGEEETEGSIQEAGTDTATVLFADSDHYEVEKEVTVFTEDGTMLGSGTVVCGHAVYVTADSGRIKSISVKENQQVWAQDTLFRLSDVSYAPEYMNLLEQREQLFQKVQTAKEYKKGFTVTAKKDGIISDLNVGEGEMLTAGMALCRLLDTESYQVVLDIDELDIQGIAPGQQVEVTLDAIADAVYQGTVTGVSMVGENNGSVGTYKVSVLLDSAENLLPGMSANGKITREQKQDVLLVPVDTLQTVDGKKVVTVVKPDGTRETREVTIGLVNNEYAEILSGVQEGEELQVIVKLEDIYSQMGITMEAGGSTE